MEFVGFFFFFQIWTILPSFTQLNAQIKIFIKYFRTQHIQIIFKITWWRDLGSPDGDCWFLERPDLLQIYRKFYLKLFRCERNRIYIDPQISVFSQRNWKLTFHPRDLKKKKFWNAEVCLGTCKYECVQQSAIFYRTK